MSYHTLNLPNTNRTWTRKRKYILILSHICYYEFHIVLFVYRVDIPSQWQLVISEWPCYHTVIFLTSNFGSDVVALTKHRHVASHNMSNGLDKILKNTNILIKTGISFVINFNNVNILNSCIVRFFQYRLNF